MIIFALCLAFITAGSINASAQYSLTINNGSGCDYYIRLTATNGTTFCTYTSNVFLVPANTVYRFHDVTDLNGSGTYGAYWAVGGPAASLSGGGAWQHANAPVCAAVVGVTDCSGGSISSSATGCCSFSSGGGLITWSYDASGNVEIDIQ